MPTLRLSVAAITLIAVGAAVALWVAQRRGGARRWSAARTPVAGGAQADERADLLAQSQDMVSEGGPAGAQHGPGH